MNRKISALVIFFLSLVSAQDTTVVLTEYSSVFTVDTQDPAVIWVFPNGGETYALGQPITGSWLADDSLFGETPVSIFLSPSIGAGFSILASDLPNSGTADIELPDINTGFARLRVTVMDYFGNTDTDESDGYFIIGDFGSGWGQDSTLTLTGDTPSFIVDTKEPTVEWYTPNGGEAFGSGGMMSVEWLAMDDYFGETSVTILISESIGSEFSIIAENIVNNGQTVLSLPEINTDFARIQIIVSDYFGNLKNDYSDGYFNIGGSDSTDLADSTTIVYNESNIITTDTKDPYVDFISPNGGEQFDPGEIITVEWEAEDDSFGSEVVSIYLADELGGYFNTIAMNIPNTDSLEVELPDANSAFSRMKITAIDTFGNTSTDYGDGYFAIGDPFNDYTVDEYEDMVIVDWNWGAHHTVFIEPSALSIFDPGVEIHIIDQNGLNQKECSFDPTYGLVSAGQYMYMGSENQLIAVISVASTINCNAEQSYSWNYMNAGETPEFVIYDQSENEYYNAYVSGNAPFSNFAFVELDTVRSTTEIMTPFSIEYNQSSQQAFYFAINAFSNDLPLTVDDWIIAMRDDVVVGARQWTGPWTDVPAMGNEGSIQKIGYVSEHQIFIAVIDEVTGNPVYYDVNYSEGTGVFDEELTVIESISLNEQSTVQSDGFLNFSEDISSETREEYQFNIYRNEQLLISNYDSQIYFDNDVQTGELYCYRIVLLDIQGEEFITSLEQCVDGIVSQCALPGDANTDGLLNVLDVVTMVSHILGTLELEPDQISCSDLNQDGSLNVLDVVMAVAIILGN